MRRESRWRRAWTWQMPLVVAVASMLAAAVLVALGHRALSDIFVTTGFAVGMLSIPIWLLFDRERA
jgi:hypothetical protein